VQRAFEVQLLLPAEGARRLGVHLHDHRREPLLRDLQPSLAAGPRCHRRVQETTAATR
jgi:hypothetical protein